MTEPSPLSTEQIDLLALIAAKQEELTRAKAKWPRWLNSGRVHKVRMELELLREWYCIYVQYILPFDRKYILARPDDPRPGGVEEL